MAPGAEHGVDQFGGVWADRLGPSDEAFRSPLAHLAVLLGHVLIGGGYGSRPAPSKRWTPASTAGQVRERGAAMMFIAGTSRKDLLISSFVRTHAQSRAELECFRARAPYIARCEVFAATMLLTVAQTTYFKRYRRAYGNWRSEVGALHRTSGAKFPQPLTMLSMETTNPSTRRRQATGHAFGHGAFDMTDRPLRFDDWRVDDQELRAWHNLRQQDRHRLAVLAAGGISRDERAALDPLAALAVTWIWGGPRPSLPTCPRHRRPMELV